MACFFFCWIEYLGIKRSSNTGILLSFFHLYLTPPLYTDPSIYYPGGGFQHLLVTLWCQNKVTDDGPVSHLTFISPKMYAIFTKRHDCKRWLAVNKGGRHQRRTSFTMNWQTDCNLFYTHTSFMTASSATQQPHDSTTRVPGYIHYMYISLLTLRRKCRYYDCYVWHLK